MRSISDVALTAKASNYLWCHAIRLGDLYVYDESHDDIIEIIFSEEELNYD